MLTLLAPPAWAQYSRTAPGNPGAAGKGGLQIASTLSIEETYTDNVGLARQGAERSDWITRLRPAISVNHTAARMRLSGAFAAEARHSLQTGNVSINPQLNASGNAELIPHLLFLDASALISQQNISLLAAQSDSNVNNTGNRATTKSFFVSPYLRHAFSNIAQGEARLRYSTVSSDASSSSLANSQSTGMGLRLASGPSFKLYTWSVAYDSDTIDFSGAQDITTQKISATGTRLLTPQVRFISTVGYDKNDYVTAGPSPSGMFWSSGVEWTPTPRTRLSATTGKRFFGTTRALDFSHRTRLTVWGASYGEDVTSARQQILVPTNVETAGFLDTLFLSAFPDPAIRQQAVQAFIAQTGLPPTLAVPVNFFTNQYFLQKRLQASFGILGVRHNVLASVFRSTRTPQDISPSGDFAATSSVEQTGANVNWNWRWSPQTASNVNVGYTRSEFSGIGRQDNLTFIRVGLSRQFESRLFGTLSYRRAQNDSDQSASGYTENALTATLSMSF